ncbi:MAG: FAD-dependent oxidoreductase [Deltaproteobacteria bacterium]|nr:FAD-dependent oxidoreductase [Deltaproteobacteria bacterium]
MTKRVAIYGGGVAGLSVAHELVERGGFDVHVYEKDTAVGGKARSQFLPGTGAAGRKDLPGEHGFRFYPSFYIHLIDTMSRIPFPADPSFAHVAKNLVASREGGIASSRDGRKLIEFPRRLPTAPWELFSTILEMVEALAAGPDLDDEDVPRFAWHMVKYLTSCRERREGQWEKLSWWEFVDGDRYSDTFKSLVRAIPRTMVAMDPKKGSARTIGNISMQFILEYTRADGDNDRTMNGPTDERWLEPWKAHLESKGATFHLGKGVAALRFDGTRITEGELADGTLVTADHHVLAVPLEVAHPLITPAIAAADPQLAAFRSLAVASNTAWMVGAQYFLKTDVPICEGHCFYPESAWALTSISQAQFWRRAGRAFEDRYGDGTVKGVLSVDVSDWETPSPFLGKAGQACSSRDEVLDEIWKQLKDGLNDKETVIRDDMVVARHLDANLDFTSGLPRNPTPLLVHPPGSWAKRPDASTRIPNLVLAGDYVRSTTDLATMEGANETARLAVNAILAAEGRSAEACQLWALDERESDLLAPFKWLDRQLYARGQDHVMDIVAPRRISATAIRAVTSLLRFLSMGFSVVT